MKEKISLLSKLSKQLQLSILWWVPLITGYKGDFQPKRLFPIGLLAKLSADV